jgi:hypothetical protein
MPGMLGRRETGTGTGDHTRAAGWTGGLSTAQFTAENAATIDKGCSQEKWPKCAHELYG